MDPLKERYMNAVVAYCSPAGSTKHVAEVIEKTLTGLGHAAVMLDLCSPAGAAASRAREIGRDSLLFIGSPVYAFHAVPAVMEFIERLPDGAAGCSVPFVTWGAVTSGIALYEMGKLLDKKGFSVLAAAKITASHSLMWQFEHPLGEGRPDALDDQKIADLVKQAVAKLKERPVRAVPLSELRYQPEGACEAMAQVSIRVARQMLPQRRVKKEVCTKCPVCSKLCPAGTISLDPYPSFGDRCILCYNCMRLCPEQAITADFSAMEAWLKEKAGEFSEDTQVKVFI
jgi:ferredoxin